MQLEFDPVHVTPVERRGNDDDLGVGDLLAQVLAQRVLVPCRPVPRRGGVAVEEVVRALEVLEDAVVVVVLDPDVA